jgi:hypothetical protein
VRNTDTQEDQHMIDRDEEEPPKRSFKVEDRRRFADSGEARDGVDDRQESQPEAAAPATPPPTEAGTRADNMPPLELNFSTFVISLSTQVLAQLGELEDPVQGPTGVDLVGAKQLIDILGILKEKTKGNLDESEKALLDHCLYDLRMKYVELARHLQAPTGPA